MRLPRKKSRPRIRVKGSVPHRLATGGKLYEIEPESYTGPWELPVGTVLEVVSTPTKGTQ